MARTTQPLTLRRTGDGVSVAFLDDPSEIARARRLVRGLLADCRPSVADDAVLVVSELVTNALVHGLPPCFLQMRLTPTRLCIDVSDGAMAPAAIAPGPVAVGGQGLRVVDRLSEAWGSDPFYTNEQSKHVWCTMALDPAR